MEDMAMEKALFRFGLTVCANAIAQDVPPIKTFTGYSFPGVNSPTNVDEFNTDDGSRKLIVSFGRWLGAVSYTTFMTAVNAMSPTAVPTRTTASQTAFVVSLGGSYQKASAYDVGRLGGLKQDNQ
jgi:hypothetical protein